MAPKSVEVPERFANTGTEYYFTDAFERGLKADTRIEEIRRTLADAFAMQLLDDVLNDLGDDEIFLGEDKQGEIFDALKAGYAAGVRAALSAELAGCDSEERAAILTATAYAEHFGA